MSERVGNNEGKKWYTVNTTLNDSAYKEILDKKVNSILKGKESIDIDSLRKNSLFSNLSEKGRQMFEKIANIDGDKTSFSTDELKVLYFLADANLENDQFTFDGKYDTGVNGGLDEANENEVNAIIDNLVDSNVKKRITKVDVSKFDNNKSFAEKLGSSDPDESMLALHDKLNVGINKQTGEPVSALQVAVLFKDFASKNISNPEYTDYYRDVVDDFTEQTGIKISNFQTRRCKGDTYGFKIGDDWVYDSGTLVNEKTGETIKGSGLRWKSSKPYTVPATRGSWYKIKEYNDGNGTTIKYSYDEIQDSDCVAPTSAELTQEGSVRKITYGPKYQIDPDIYNFKDKDN